MNDIERQNENFSFALRVGEVTLRFDGHLPPAGAGVDAMVPLLHAVGRSLLEETAPRNEAVSCGPRCGACCRQLVPISLSESVYLHERVIPGLSLDHRERVAARISEAARRLAEEGLEAPLENLPQEGDSLERRKLGLAYFRLGIPCPFLEDESCSIHPQRPLACREYLVKSPPERCSMPNAAEIQQVQLPVKPSNALIVADAARTGTSGWIPMISALMSGPSEAGKMNDPALFLQSFLSGLNGNPGNEGREN